MLRKILVMADDCAVGLHYEETLRAAGYDVAICDHPHDGVETASAGDFDVILVCRSTPQSNPLDVLRRVKTADASLRVVILNCDVSVESAMEAMRDGAADFLPEPCSANELRSALRRLEQSTTSAPPADRPASHPPRSQAFEGMLGQCQAMRDVFALIERIAPSDATVLVTGESGTGKEMVVRAIHGLSRRRDYPFLGCDCTVLAPTLLESELFGHVKGSFSGAIATKKGLFEAAHQGTLLLDEVSNLSMETQGKLLRVLETRQIRKVGDTTERELDIRLIATTNRSLAEMVKVGAFRADLYYRLNVVPVSLPPLRDRPGDIPLLANVFLERFSRQLDLELNGFSSEAMRQMEIYSWPGNVRELRNIVERLAVLYGGSQIEWQHLPSEIREAKCAVSSSEVPRTWEEFKGLKRRLIEDLERRFLTAALERCPHSITQAAESVGMQRTNFHALLRHHGLRPETIKRKERP